MFGLTYKHFSQLGLVLETKPKQDKHKDFLVCTSGSSLDDDKSLSSSSRHSSHLSFRAYIHMIILHHGRVTSTTCVIRGLFMHGKANNLTNQFV